MKLNELKAELAKRLASCSGDDAEFETTCILADFLGCSNSALRLKFADEADEGLASKAYAAVERRLQNEPLQYILGKWEFYSNEFFVGEGVLIPRPETEQLVELAINLLKSVKNPVCYDLCSGSGCIGISVAKALENSSVYMLEKSEKAFEYLKKNIVLNSAVGCKPQLGDVFEGSAFCEKADLILSNPPYICSAVIPTLQKEVQKEPIMALDGGTDGLEFYRAICNKWLSSLKSGGCLAVEIGEEQGEAVKAIFEPYFTKTEIIKDCFGNNRIVAAYEKQ